MPVNRSWNPPQEHGCGDCRYWAGNCVSGPCRRHAPIVAKRADLDYERRMQWPQTTQEDWCGDWEPRVGDDPTASPPDILERVIRGIV